MQLGDDQRSTDGSDTDDSEDTVIPGRPQPNPSQPIWGPSEPNLHQPWDPSSDSSLPSDSEDEPSVLIRLNVSTDSDSEESQEIVQRLDGGRTQGAFIWSRPKQPRVATPEFELRARGPPRSPPRGAISSDDSDDENDLPVRIGRLNVHGPDQAQRAAETPPPAELQPPQQLPRLQPPQQQLQLPQRQPPQNPPVPLLPPQQAQNRPMNEQMLELLG